MPTKILKIQAIKFRSHEHEAY